MQSGEQREKIREYLPAGMVGEDVIVKIERRGPGEGEVSPTFTIPDGFDVFFRAVIRYRGPFSVGHETGAMWLYNAATFEFMVRGGDDYNYVI